MKHILTSIARRISVGLVLLALIACGAGSNADTQPAAVATITALPVAKTRQPSASTSTPAPTLPPVAQFPELQDAQAQVKANNFEMAVNLLNRVYATHRDNAEVQQQFAKTYLLWGQNILATSAGDPALVSRALDKFTSGLAVAPQAGAERQQLQTEADLAQTFLEATSKLQALKALVAAKADSAQQRDLAGALAGLLKRLRELRPDFPGLQQLYVQGMVAAGEVYLAAAQGAEQDALRGQALDYCGQALQVDPQNAAALACQQRAVPTPTPQPQPTRAPVATRPTGRLKVAKINSNDAPGCVSIGITGTAATRWTFMVDGLRLGGTFSGGNARVCGLPDHAVTFTIRDGSGQPVPGGSGIPAAGRDIFVASWR